MVRVLFIKAFGRDACKLRKVMFMETNVTRERRDYSEFKKLEKRVRDVAYRYRYAQSKMQAYEQSKKKDLYLFNEVSEPSKETKRFEKTLFSVENALNFLEPEHKFLIEQDYLAGENDFWWVNRYSRSTYYRIKRHAMIEFLSFFD